VIISHHGTVIISHHGTVIISHHGTVIISHHGTHGLMIQMFFWTPDSPFKWLTLT
jgi:hypothetical protein